MLVVLPRTSTSSESEVPIPGGLVQRISVGTTATIGQLCPTAVTVTSPGVEPNPLPAIVTVPPRGSAGETVDTVGAAETTPSK